MVTQGSLWTDGSRMYYVISVNDLVVTYEDHYATGEMCVRKGSEIQWGVDVEEGRMIKLGG